ncbi:histidine phosphatase superfamily [Lipomyces orientalis]|uniref:Histidine phosphatase superfamily n=1 Tax=Lipomyces orientalis TaxID=1233043 RepID=A0ACC3TP39_9ASCO
MSLKRILVVRHSTRLDTKDLSWRDTSPTPYDPPLSQSGILEAGALGRAIASEIAASVDSGADSADTAASAFARPTRDLSPASRTSDRSSVGTDSSSALTMGSSAASASPPCTFPSSRPLTVYIHTSPFLRCAMTAHYIAQQLVAMAPVASSSAPSTVNLKIRIDSFLGEWLTPDYFSSISPPPDDGHTSLAASSMSWLVSNGSRNILDLTWPLNSFGVSGQYGERWKTMYWRFSTGLSNLVASYAGPAPGDSVVILVTHGAGSNALVGALSGTPILVDFGLASLSVAVPRRRTDREDEYSSVYGYGGEKRNRSGYGLLFDDNISNNTGSGMGKWDLTRIADVSHLGLLRGVKEDDPPRTMMPKFEFRTSTSPMVSEYI